MRRLFVLLLFLAFVPAVACKVLADPQQGGQILPTAASIPTPISTPAPVLLGMFVNCHNTCNQGYNSVDTFSAFFNNQFWAGIHYDGPGDPFPSAGAVCQAGGAKPLGSCESLDYAAVNPITHLSQPRIPYISWVAQASCGGPGGTAAAIANTPQAPPWGPLRSGGGGGAIDTRADQYLAAWADPVKNPTHIPVIIRLCWEFNNLQTTPTPTDFIAMWRTVHDETNLELVAAGCGSTYPTCTPTQVVKWYWSGAAALNNANGIFAYYVGDAYVDYVGGDGYDRTGSGFSAVFSNFFNLLAQAATNCTLTPSGCVSVTKPVIIGETAAASTRNQNAYFIGSHPPPAPAMTQADLHLAFPRLYAVAYFNASGSDPWEILSTNIGPFNAFNTP